MAYGARLESVLGESPRGFESPILRLVVPRDIVHICLDGLFTSWARPEALEIINLYRPRPKYVSYSGKGPNGLLDRLGLCYSTSCGSKRGVFPSLAYLQTQLP